MIHLVNMPFASMIHPSLALGQFKAQLKEAGLESQVYNFNFDLAIKAGILNYELVAKSKGFNSQLGEWFFAKEAWGEEFGPSLQEFIDLCGGQIDTLEDIEDPVGWLAQVRTELVPAFLDECCDRLFAQGPPQVVAFTCTFFQTVASLALARRIKQRSPQTRVAFGGSCLHGEMGDEFIRKFPYMDAVSVGEADDVIVPLLRSLLEGREPEGLQGVLYRRGDQVIEGLPARPLPQDLLEEVPDPDFDDYFRDLKNSGMIKDQSVTRAVFLPYESSRGCWWGEKQHCTFCGLNNEGMNYRNKSAERVVSLLRGLMQRYGVRRLDATDNILPIPFFKTLLPKLRDEPLEPDPVLRARHPVTLFYEVKANLTREQVKVLGDAGVRFVQPGIESLSSHILKQMRKGVKAIHNIYMLKLCRTFNVYPMWNMLYGFPGERVGDYEAMAELVPKMVHFQPPYGGPRRLELHRFSPYFSEKGRWVENLRPRSWYRGLFPEDKVDLARVAYYFDGDWKEELPVQAYETLIDRVWTWLDVWRASPRLPRLDFGQDEQGRYFIVDTRIGRSGRWMMDEWEGRIYSMLDDPTPFSRLRKDLGGAEANEKALRNTLDDFVANGIAIEEGGLYLGLALPQNVFEADFGFRRHYFNKVGQRAQREAENTLEQNFDSLKLDPVGSTVDRLFVSR
jgi:ribosomal peptide maturation radical SAM protein 1